MTDHRIESLEARLARLEDLQALKTLMDNYHQRCDAFEWTEWAESFAEDAVVEARDAAGVVQSFGVMRGRQAVYETCRDNMAIYAAIQHIIVNLNFKVTGDVATGTANLVFVAVADRARPDDFYMSGGRYEWTFARTPQGWKISTAVLDFLWNNGSDDGGLFGQDHERASA
jgi:hypothetical protein